MPSTAEICFHKKMKDMLYEKTSNCMRKTIFFLMLVSISISAISQSKTIVLFEKETYYPDQVWFASHVQKDIEDSIQFYWNHGYRITDASYNSCGWVVVMAKNSGIRMQTYKFHQYWPSEWISTSRKSQYTASMETINLFGFMPSF